MRFPGGREVLAWFAISRSTFFHKKNPCGNFRGSLFVGKFPRAVIFPHFLVLIWSHWYIAQVVMIYDTVMHYFKKISIDLDTFGITRSRHRTCSVRKGVLRYFAKFTGKHLCQNLLFNKVADLKPATLLKKTLWHRCFPVKFAKFWRTPFYRSPLHDCF